MVTVKIKDGTPEGGQSLCVTCRWAHIVKGFSASQQIVRCRWIADDPLVQFPVSQCSSYDDRRLPCKRDMEKIAWILLTKTAGRNIGFVTAKRFLAIEQTLAEIAAKRAAGQKLEPNLKDAAPAIIANAP
jgi:hypothetical protein